jgi:hypothetical protein
LLPAQPLKSALIAQQPIVQARPTKITATEARQLQQLFARQSPAKTVALNHAFRINVSTFGSCLFTPVVDRSRGAAKLSLHLVKNDRIVYTFPQPSWIQPWSLHDLKAVAFTELNFDGGDGDIILISEYIAGASGAGTSPPFPVVLVFLTEERGYELDTEISQILTRRKVSTIAQAETIMRREFQYLP